MESSSDDSALFASTSFLKRPKKELALALKDKHYTFSFNNPLFKPPIIII